MTEEDNFEQVCDQYKRLVWDCDYSIGPEASIYKGPRPPPDETTYQLLETTKTKFLQLLKQETDVHRLYSLYEKFIKTSITEMEVFIVKRIAELLSPHPLLYVYIAGDLITIGEEEEAYEYFQRAKRLDPKLKDVLYLQLGCAMIWKDSKGIQSTVDQILTSYPNDCVGLKAEVRLKENPNDPFYNFGIPELSSSANLRTVLRTMGVLGEGGK